MFSLSITPFAYFPQFYDECLLAPVLPYRGDLHKAVHDIIRSVTPLKKITTLNFFITFEMSMLTASKYYNSETSALWNIAPTKLASTSQALNTSMDLLCMQYYLPVTPMLIADSSSPIGMFFSYGYEGLFCINSSPCAVLWPSVKTNEICCFYVRWLPKWDDDHFFHQHGPMNCWSPLLSLSAIVSYAYR